MKVTGSGTIQLTQNATDPAQSIRNDAIGMWEVSGFEISGIRAIGGTTPYIGLYFNENGVVGATIPGTAPTGRPTRRWRTTRRR